MERFIKLYEQIAAGHQDTVAVEMDTTGEKYTYRELDDASGRIYRYLKEHGIGREDRVLFVLPRGPKAVIAMMGVVRAGAAFTIIEDTYPADRVEFIRNNFDAKLVLNAALYQEMMQLEPLTGHEETEQSDACFAVYTSGTTGTPKGVLHEYGKLDLHAAAISGMLAANGSKERLSTKGGYVLASPLNFVASIMSIVAQLLAGDTLYILSYETVKDLGKYMAFIREKKTSSAFLTPSMIRILKDKPECLKVLVTGGEPANGLYDPSVHIVNHYGMSEAGFNIARFVIDKPYDVTPVGKTATNIPLLVLDEDGKELPDGEVGEICFENPFTRGYINLPEQTAKAFRDGLFHTGDMGYKNENGDLVISGRSDDMIKINGNRIEPAEIENVIKREYGIKNAVAKGFDQDGRSFVALYYLRDEAEAIFGGKTADEINAAVKTKLPSYMLPTYYVAIDALPINQNGKISRKLLKAPELGQDEDYVAPGNALETRLCQAMAGILKLSRISVEADFFEHGGDSLRVIRLVSECGELGITSPDVYRCRTARKLAAFCAEHAGEEDMASINAAAMKKRWPLMPGQLVNLKYLLPAPESTMLNVPKLFVLPEGTDIPRLVAAVRKAFQAHPSILSRITQDENGAWLQYYAPEEMADTAVIETTEEEFKQSIGKLIAPFTIKDSAMYRSCICRTEKSLYLFIDFSHLLMDGSSLKLVCSDISAFYDDPDYQPKPDYYYAILKQYFDERGSEAYQAAKAWYEQTYHQEGGIDSLKTWLRLDHDVPMEDVTIEKFPLGTPDEVGSGNIRCMTAMAMAVAKYNGTDRALTYWIYSNRDSIHKMNCAAELVMPLPFYLVIEKDDTPQTLMAKAEKQAEAGMSCIAYSYILDRVDDIENVLRYIYQKDMYVPATEGLLQQSPPLLAYIHGAPGVMGVNVMENTTRNDMAFWTKYSNRNLDRESIVRLEQYFVEAMQYLKG